MGYEDHMEEVLDMAIDNESRRRPWGEDIEEIRQAAINDLLEFGRGVEVPHDEEETPRVRREG